MADYLVDFRLNIMGVGLRNIEALLDALNDSIGGDWQLLGSDGNENWSASVDNFRNDEAAIRRDLEHYGAQIDSIRAG